MRSEYPGSIARLLRSAFAETHPLSQRLPQRAPVLAIAERDGKVAIGFFTRVPDGVNMQTR